MADPISELADLLPRVAVHVPLAPRNAQLQALRDAFEKFCDASNAWREWIEIEETANTPSYTLATTHSGARIAAVEQVRRISPGTPAGDLYGTEIHRAHYGVNISGDTARFFPRWVVQISNQTTLRVLVVLMPIAGGAEGVDDIPFLSTWATGIVAHAVWDLASRVRRPWTNPAIAARHRLEFSNQASSAGIVALRELPEANNQFTLSP